MLGCAGGQVNVRLGYYDLRANCYTPPPPWALSWNCASDRGRQGDGIGARGRGARVVAGVHGALKAHPGLRAGLHNFGATSIFSHSLRLLRFTRHAGIQILTADYRGGRICCKCRSPNRWSGCQCPHRVRRLRFVLPRPSLHVWCFMPILSTDRVGKPLHLKIVTQS